MTRAPRHIAPHRPAPHHIAIAAMLLLASAPVNAADLFDGTYGGTTTLVRNNGRIGSGEPLCSVTATRANWQVVENTILLTWQGSDWRAPIRPDGTISNSATVGGFSVSASGKVTGPSMVLFFGSQACGYRFDGFKGG